MEQFNMGECFMKQTIKQRRYLGGAVGSDIYPNIKQRHLVQIENMKTIRTNNMLGLVGMFFIQGATLPSLFSVVFANGTPPPLTLLVGVFVGLMFYQARAIRNFNTEWVYAIGNTIGLLSNGTLIYLSIY